MATAEIVARPVDTDRTPGEVTYTWTLTDLSAPDGPALAQGTVTGPLNRYREFGPWGEARSQAGRAVSRAARAHGSGIWVRRVNERGPSEYTAEIGVTEYEEGVEVTASGRRIHVCVNYVPANAGDAN